MVVRALLAAGAAAACTSALAASSPNFLFIITDDQDIELGSMQAMPALNELVVEPGKTFQRAYVDSPICCPSRTSLFSGRLSQNLADFPTLGWCGNFSEQMDNTWTTSLGSAGYAVGQFGKWFNQEQIYCNASSPFLPAWKSGESTNAQLSDFNVMCSEGRYYGIPFNVNGKIVDRPGTAPSDYLTSVIGNASLAWLDAVTNVTNNPTGIPWAGYVAMHAPHLPATPAPWYANASLPGSEAPRTPNWNVGWADKHWQVDNGLTTPMGPGLIEGSDALWAARLRTLMSVDDFVRSAVQLLAAREVLDNTFIVYTSDHGYHLGQWAIAGEKAQPYETDSRVPLFVRGPGVQSGSTSQALVSNVDFGPTILELAGIPNTWPDGRGQRDGTSFVPALVASDPAPPPGWRDRLLIQFAGWTTPYEWLTFCEFNVTTCPPAPNVAWLANGASNCYTSLRVKNATHDTLFAEYRPQHTALAPASTNWTEAYDLSQDPWQMTNLAVKGRLPPATLAAMHDELWAVATCVGAACP